MLNVIYKPFVLSGIRLSVVRLSGIRLSDITLNVINKPFVLSVVRLSVVRLNVVWLSVVRLSVVRLNVIMVSVVVPHFGLLAQRKSAGNWMKMYPGFDSRKAFHSNEVIRTLDTIHFVIQAFIQKV